MHRQQDPFTGEYHVPYMKWFLKRVNQQTENDLVPQIVADVRQGEPLKESEPSIFEFVKSQPVSRGRPKEIRIDIYFDMDRENKGAPQYKTSGEQ